VMFSGLSGQVEQAEVIKTLSEKLKTQPQKVTGLLQGKSLFAPYEKNKALKHTKLLVSLGIKSKLQSVNNTVAESTSSEDNKARDDQHHWQDNDPLTGVIVSTS
ncbi:MAG: hypothetical protein ACTJFM_07150, partial [Pseudoalteromonas sp.]